MESMAVIDRLDNISQVLVNIDKRLAYLMDKDMKKKETNQEVELE